MTALSRLIATMAAQRLGLTPTLAPLDRPSFHVDGRYTRAEEPETNGMHLPRGYSRNPRPDLNQVMLDLRVEHPAGIPLLMPPLRGNTSAAIAFRPVVTEHMAQLPMTYGTASRVAESALYTEENLPPRAHTQRQGSTRVPATLREAHAALAAADPATLEPLVEG